MLKPNPKQDLWFVGGEVTEGTLFLQCLVRYFTQGWPKKGLGGKIKHYVSFIEKDLSLMYFLRSEFDAEVDFLMHKMIDNPDWGE